MTRNLFSMTSIGMILMLLLAGCTGPVGQQGPAGPAGPVGAVGPAGADSQVTCKDCHNDTDLITGMRTAWEGSLHGSGTTTAYAGSRVIPGTGGCNGCHSGGGFSERIAGNVPIKDIAKANPNPSRIDCRACHQIHTSYTKTDWALETIADVNLDALDAKYSGGMGNLCANCHQPINAFPRAENGIVKVTSTHWGAHHGPVAAMLLGIGGGSGLTGEPSLHLKQTKDSCVSCHMGEGKLHSFTPAVANCTGCHPDATSLDIGGVQTNTAKKLEEVKAALTRKGLLDSKGVMVVGDYPEAQAAALWNYLMVEEDKSLGVHNASYANMLLDAALEGLK